MTCKQRFGLPGVHPPTPSHRSPELKPEVCTKRTVLTTNAWGAVGGDTGMARDCRGWGSRRWRTALIRSVDCRLNSAHKIFVYMSRINKEKLPYFFENGSIVLQRTVIGDVNPAGPRPMVRVGPSDVSRVGRGTGRCCGCSGNVCFWLQFRRRLRLNKVRVRISLPLR